MNPISEQEKKSYVEGLKVTQSQRERAFTVDQGKDRQEWLGWRGIGPHPETQQPQPLARLPASLWHLALSSEQKDWASLIRQLGWPRDLSQSNDQFLVSLLHYGSTMEGVPWLHTKIFLTRWLKSRGYVQIIFLSPGTLIGPDERFFLNASTDGLCVALHLDGHLYVCNIEIKCPQKPYEETPDKYQTQFQGSSEFLCCPEAWFVMYLPQRTVFRRYLRQSDHFERHVFPRLRHFFFNLFLPRAVLRDRGEISEDQIELPHDFPFPFPEFAPPV